MIREKCVICSSGNLSESFRMENMPVFMGVTEFPTEGIKSDMIFMECENCKTIQLGKLIDPNILYSYNHNVETVGKLWNQHYPSFLKFMGNSLDSKTILEIGDPSAKIANLTDKFKKWYIVEKNPALESNDRLIFIEKFFDDDFQIDEKIDVIVNSHLFEHLFNPKEFLLKCNSLLVEGGDIFISTPDFKHFMDGDFLPNSILQFEHTFYFDLSHIKYLCSITGFDLVDFFLYENHSIFLHLKKSDSKKDYELPSDKISDKFLQKYHTLKQNISSINKVIENKENVYLYGAHITSQSFIFNGLNLDNICGLLDGSNAKVGKYLYGTNLKTYSPEVISDMESVTVICSNMGIYTNEISDNLININSKVNLI